MKNGATSKLQERWPRVLPRSGLLIGVIAMSLLGVGGCFGFGSPSDDDRDSGGFDSAVISRCRVVVRVMVETDVAWLASSSDPGTHPEGDGVDVSEIVQIDVGGAGVDASYDRSNHHFTASWNHGPYDETYLDLTLNDSGTAVLSMELEQTVSEDADLYRLTRRWEIEARNLPYVGGDPQQGVWFRVDGEQMCGALSSVAYRREVAAAGFTVLEQLSSHSCNDQSFLEVYLEP